MFPTPAAAPPPPAPTLPPLPTLAPLPTAGTGPRRDLIYVANTDGEGVFLRRLSAARRADPRASGRHAADGDRRADPGVCETWLPVRAPEGTEGWVPQRFHLRHAGAAGRVTPRSSTCRPPRHRREDARDRAHAAPQAGHPDQHPAGARPARRSGPASAPGRVAGPTARPGRETGPAARAGPAPPKVFIPPVPPTGIPLPGAVPKP